MEEQLSVFEPNLNQSKVNNSIPNDPVQILLPELQLDPNDEQKARQVIAIVASKYSEEQISEAIAEIRYLTECWLNDFERGLFDGKTLDELLYEKGGL